jgi:hypothetical protein
MNVVNKTRAVREPLARAELEMSVLMRTRLPESRRNVIAPAALNALTATIFDIHLRMIECWEEMNGGGLCGSERGGERRTLTSNFKIVKWRRRKARM